MQLILLLILFGVVGYWLANTGFRDKVNRVSDRASSTSWKWSQRMRGWWSARFSGTPDANALRAWVEGTGADDFPESFKEWFLGLTAPEAEAFTAALDEYADGLGYNLAQLVAGGLQHKPGLKQVFVEAIVVYSDAYRKAKQAKEDAEEEEKSEEAEKKAAKKSPSRRREPAAA